MRYVQISSQSEARKELEKIGVDPYGIEAMVPKMSGVNVLLEEIECKVANILKQEMLSLGGDVAVSRGSVDCSVDRTDAIIIGTVKQLKRLVDKIFSQPFGLKKISQNINTLLVNLEKDSFILKTPSRDIRIGRSTLIMGIINVTPDSFSDGGMFNCVEDAVEYCVKLEEEGADILDVGGESSRPGSESISAEEELKRVIPVIEGLKKRVNIPISIDTTKADVAREAAEKGAEIVNDISAMRFDEAMAEVVASYGIPVVLMHMRGIPKTMQEGNLTYRSVLGEVIQFLEERIAQAVSSGIDRNNIIIDPGIGFGKNEEDNLRLLRHLGELKTLGSPILVGASRKRFIGGVIGGEPLNRIEGTAATGAVAIMNGANILRVHDVKFVKKIAQMTDSIKRE